MKIGFNRFAQVAARFVAVGLFLAVVGCGGSSADVDVVDDVAVVDVAADVAADVAVDVVEVIPADYTKFGPYPVGHVNMTLHDTVRDRVLPVEVWYPATEAVRQEFETGKPIQDMFEGHQLDLFTTLLEGMSDCATKTVHGVRNAELAPGQWPLVLFSHCGGCIRTSNISLAERLASHGFAVASADHVGDTLWETLDGLPNAGLSPEFLPVRGGDVPFVLDKLLDVDAQEVPAIIRGRFDADSVAMFGHSFGGMTTAYATSRDNRIKGCFLHTVPFDSFYDLTDPAEFTKPFYTILAVEDSMIYSIGNDDLRNDFAQLKGPSWKAEVQDTGHLSFCDVCKVKESFRDCCGEGVRQTDFNPFTYMDQQESMQIGATYTTAFMYWLLKGDKAARTVFETPANDRVSIEIRNAPAL
jgi:predicted dienelactone hydrolase